MKRITFEYYDRYCKDGIWSKQTGTFETVEKCIEFYGLGVDCQYRIISVEEV